MKLPKIKPTHLAIAGGALLVWALLPKRRILPMALVSPLNAPVTSNFGWRIHPTLGIPKLHEGVDLGASRGTPVRAAAAGTVAHRGVLHEVAGNNLRIDHGNGVATRYLHLDSFAPDVRLGGTAAKGQVIGYVGATGRVTGPHLHFEVSVNGEAIDPMEVIAVA